LGFAYQRCAISIRHDDVSDQKVHRAFSQNAPSRISGSGNCDRVPDFMYCSCKHGENFDIIVDHEDSQSFIRVTFFVNSDYLRFDPGSDMIEIHTACLRD
jgi:hypothetical protein